MALAGNWVADAAGDKGIGPVDSGTGAGKAWRAANITGDYADGRVVLYDASGAALLVAANPGVVQGPTAHDAAAAGNPVQIGLVYRATKPAVIDLDAVSALGDAAGRLEVLQSATVTYAHTQPAATTVSGAMLAANTARKYALLVNDSDTTVYIKVGAVAIANQGIRLNPNGGSFEMSSAMGNLATAAINGIHAGSGNKAVLVVEAT